MPRPRFKNAAPELRDAILDVAARELAEKGYEGASLNQIIVAAGLSKGAFYYYFDDKTDLVATVFERETQPWLTMISELRMPDSAEDFWAELDRMTTLGLNLMYKDATKSNLMGRMATAMGRHPELLARLGPTMHEASSRLVAVFRRGQSVGAVRDDLSAELLVAVIQGEKQALSNSLLPADRAPTREEWDEFVRIHVDLTRRILMPSPPRG